jgi:hypothetical protein
MEASERDTTDEWRIAPARVPATVVELEGRIDVALATARTAEEAALEIGAASIEAAQQARRAAEMAERASAAAVRAADAAAAPRLAPVPAPAGTPTPSEPAPSVVAPITAAPEPPPAEPATTEFAPPPVASWSERANGAAPRRPDPFDERITAFRQRAEKVMIRLQKIEAGAAPGDGPTEVVRLR